MKNYITKIINLVKKSNLVKARLDVFDNAFEIEHLLYFSNISGDLLDNNSKKIKDLKQDIADAIKFESAVSLAIALKLPPLNYSLILNQIFDTLAKNNLNNIINTLNLKQDDSYLSNILLANEDWQVRANIVNVISYLNLTQYLNFLEQMLDKAFNDQTPDFIYLSQAIANISPAKAMEILPKYLYCDNFWAKIDATSSLAKINSSLKILLSSLHNSNIAIDCQSFIILQNFDINEIFNKDYIAGCIIANNIIKSVENKDNFVWSDIDIDIEKIDQLISSSLKNNLNCTSILNYYEFANKINKKIDFDNFISVEELKHKITQSYNSDLIVFNFENYDLNLKSNFHEKYCSIKLMNYYNINSHTESLSQELYKQNIFINEIIQALIKFKNYDTILDFANKVILPNRSINSILNEHNSYDENKEQILIYKNILACFANSNFDKIYSFILDATKDISPEIRLEALKSINIYSQNNNKLADSKFIEVIKSCLNDPNDDITKYALYIAKNQPSIEYIDSIMKTVFSSKHSIRKASHECLKYYAVNGMKDEIIKLINLKYNSPVNLSKKNTIKQILQEL